VGYLGWYGIVVQVEKFAIYQMCKLSRQQQLLFSVCVCLGHKFNFQNGDKAKSHVACVSRFLSLATATKLIIEEISLVPPCQRTPGV